MDTFINLKSNISMRKINLWLASFTALLLLSFNSMAQEGGINTGNPKLKFGENTSYDSGRMPSSTVLPSSGEYGRSQAAADQYNYWVDNFVEKCNDGTYRVKFDNTAQTVSEGIGYGMLLSAYAGDKVHFDGFWAFFKKSMNSHGLMNWMTDGCNGNARDNAATDADLDAAHALIIASEQWPDASTDYMADAKTLLKNIHDYEMTSDGLTMVGDAWYAAGYTCFNPSYFSPAYYKQYALVDVANADFWNKAATASSDFLKKNRNASSGLVTNWCNENGVPNTCGPNNPKNEYGSDACRSPWRMAVDVLWHGTEATESSKEISNLLAAWVEGEENTLKGPMQPSASGPSAGLYQNGSYTTFALSAMAADGDYQASLDKCYSSVAGLGHDGAYFNETVRAIVLFTITGNFWKPGSTGQVRGPEVLSAETNGDGTEITVVFTKDLDSPSSNEASNFTVSIEGAEQSGSVTGLSTVDSKTIKLTVKEGVIGIGQMITLNYAGGNITSSDGADLKAFTDQYVKNSLQGNSSIIDDCEDGNALNFMGGAWFTYNDAGDNGATTIEPLTSVDDPLVMSNEGADGSDRGIYIKYSLDQGGFEWEPFCGVGTSFTMDKQERDLTGSTGISFWFKGDEIRVQPQVDVVTDGGSYEKVVTASPSWKFVSLKWSDFVQPEWAEQLGTFDTHLDIITGINWHVKGKSKTDKSSGEVWIDYVTLEGYVPTLATGLTISPSKINYTPGTNPKDTFSLEAVYTPENLTYQEILWESDNEDVVTIDEEGLVTVVGTGSANIIASLKMEPAVTAKCIVTIKGEDVLPTALTVDANKTEIEVDQTATLSVTFEPDNVTDESVTWESSDPTIAQVDAYGVVTGKSVGGPITITATSNADKTVSNTIDITVIATAVTGIDLDQTDVTITVGDYVDVVATVVPDNATNQDLIWDVTDGDIASVSDGRIIGKAAGNTTVTVTSDDDNSVSETINVEVKGASVESVSVDPISATIAIGEKFTISAEAAPSSAAQTFTWESSDDQIASVTSGLVEGTGEGTAYIKAISTEDATIFATCTVTVSAIKVTKINLSTSSEDIFVGDEITIEVLNVEPEGASEEVTWSSSAPTIADVDETTGVVTALKEGSATITATAADGSDVTAEVAITVSDVLPTSVSTAEDIGFIEGDDPQTLTATVLPKNTTNAEVEWSSDDEDVATVDPTTGKVTPVAEGTCNITVTCVADNSVTAVCIVTVAKDKIPVTGVTIDPSEVSLAVGATQKLSAVIEPEDATIKSVSWESDNTDAVEVDDNGVITAIAEGEATITVTTTDGDKTATCKVTVADTKVSKITLSETTLDLFENSDNVTITATIEPEGASTELNWESDDTDVVTVVNGTIIVKGIGTATITATATDGSEEFAEIAVTVNPVAVTGVSISPEAVTLAPEGTKVLSIEITPSDASNKNVSWESDDTDVATVDENGIVTAVADGTATITVTTEDGSEVATCTVTVGTPVTGVILSKEDLTLEISETATLTATVQPSGASNTNVSWESSKSTVASVSSSGKITAKAEGTAEITVTTEDGEYTATCTVTVTSVMTTSLSIDNSLSLGVEETATIDATILPSGASQTLTWESDNEDVATVSSTGKVTAHSAGKANITATTTDGTEIKSNDCVVTVTAVEVEGVELDETSIILDITDASFQLTATVKPEDALNQDVTWSSTKATVASVSTSGKVTPKTVGITTIKVVTDENAYSATCKVEVVDQSELDALISDAKSLRSGATEGTDVGEYEVGSKATLLSAINDAEDVLDAESTQAELDDAVSALEDAINAFNKAKIVDGTVIFDAEIGNQTYLATYWFSFNDKQADPDETGASIVDPLTDMTHPFTMSKTGYESDSAAKISYTLDAGSLPYDPFVGMGMPFVDGEDEDGKKLPYDLTGSTGISFAYKCDQSVYFEVSLTTIGDAANYMISLPKATTWTVKDLAWSDLEQYSWGKAVDWDLTQVTQIQWKVQTTDGTSGDLWVDNVEIKGVVLDLPSLVQKGALEAAISQATDLHNGAKEGTGNGEYAVGSKATLMDAIEDAEDVVNDDNADQDDVDQAVKTLEDAVFAFIDGLNGEVDKSELEKAILVAGVTLDVAEIGTAVGQFSEDAASDLENAIADAEEVFEDAGASPTQVSTAASELEDAVKAFVESKLGNGINRADLESTIETAQEAFTMIKPFPKNPSAYSDSLKSAFYTSINDAIAVLENGNATQEEITAADEKLLKAYGEFVAAYTTTGIVDAKSVGFTALPTVVETNVTVSCELQITAVKLISNSGTVVWSEKGINTTEASLNLADIAAGSYTLAATLSNGSTVYSKIVK